MINLLPCLLAIALGLSCGLTAIPAAIAAAPIGDPTAPALTSEASAVRVTPSPPASPEPPPEADSKTYFLQVAAGSIKRQITLDPPATKLIVTVESGNALVRCGVRGANPADNHPQTYTCTSGKPLIIERDPDQAIEHFWAQDLSEINDVQLRLESYSVR